MKDETREWLTYAEDNLSSAEILLSHRLWNPSLQNCQQAVEKTLKAPWIEMDIPFRKTHRIGELADALRERGVDHGLSEEAVDMLDSIYLSSKYPAGNALPDFEPDEPVCQKCIEIARAARDAAGRHLAAGERGLD